MKRYWISWWSGYYADEGCTRPPFQVWISGYKEREHHGLTPEQLAESIKLDNEDKYFAYLDKYRKDDASICALVDAKNEEEIWETISKHFPDYKIRFCEEKDLDFTPSNRFGNFENKTSLKEIK